MEKHSIPRPQNRSAAIQHCTHLTYLGREGQSKLLTDSSKVISDKHTQSICPLRSHSSVLLPGFFLVLFFLQESWNVTPPTSTQTMSIAKARESEEAFPGCWRRLLYPLQLSRTPPPPILFSPTMLIHSNNYILRFSPMRSQSGLKSPSLPSILPSQQPRGGQLD